MIYLADQWPAAYRDKLFTLNFHGRRVNVERLERSGSGYVGRHEPDILFAADPWFRGIDLGYGPDGGVFVLDWSDTGECHDHDGVHRDSGRIFKITHGEPVTRRDRRPRPGSTSLRWWPCIVIPTNGSSARRGGSWPSGRPAASRSHEAEDIAPEHLRPRPGPVPKVPRPLVAVSSSAGPIEPSSAACSTTNRNRSRAWAIRLLTDDMPLDTIFSRRIGPGCDLPPTSRRIRRPGSRRPVGPGATGAGLDASADANVAARRPGPALASRSRGCRRPQPAVLDLDGLIPVADDDPSSLVALAAHCRLPDVVRWTARRLGEEIETRPAPVNALLEVAASKPAAFQSISALGSRRGPGRLAQGEEARGLGRLPDQARRRRRPGPPRPGRDLNVVFGDGRALEEVRRLALDDKAAIETRKAALEDLDREPAARLAIASASGSCASAF